MGFSLIRKKKKDVDTADKDQPATASTPTPQHQPELVEFDFGGLPAKVKRYYVYKNKAEKLHSAMGIVDKCVAGRVDPNELWRKIIATNGEPPPDDWQLPDMYKPEMCSMNQVEAVEKIRAMYADAGRPLTSDEIQNGMEGSVMIKFFSYEAEVNKWKLKLDEIQRSAPAQSQSQSQGSGTPPLGMSAASPTRGSFTPESRAVRPRRVTPPPLRLSDMARDASVASVSNAKTPRSTRGSMIGATPLSRSFSDATVKDRLSHSHSPHSLMPSIDNESRLKLRDQVKKAELQRQGLQQQNKQQFQLSEEAATQSRKDELSSLYQEVQLLKRTVQEQVDAHQHLIDLQRGQQAFLNEYLKNEDRESEEMTRHARYLQQQYANVLDRWQSFGGGPGRLSADGQKLIPAMAHTPVLPSPRSKTLEVWLSNLGLESYSDIFTYNEIDFQSLVLLDEDDLVRMGVSALGPRKTLIQAIYRLQKDTDRRPTVKAASPITEGRLSKSSSPKRQASPRRSFSKKKQRSTKQVISPSNWEVHVDSQSGNVYYYNTATGESRWESPGAKDFLSEMTDML